MKALGAPVGVKVTDEELALPAYLMGAPEQTHLASVLDLHLLGENIAIYDPSGTGFTTSLYKSTARLSRTGHCRSKPSITAPASLILVLLSDEVHTQCRAESERPEHTQDEGHADDRRDDAEDGRTEEVECDRSAEECSEKRRNHRPCRRRTPQTPDQSRTQGRFLQRKYPLSAFVSVDDAHPTGPSLGRVGTVVRQLSPVDCESPRRLSFQYCSRP